MAQHRMAQHKEIEIKFWIEDLKALERKLRSSGFRRVTPRTHEYNTLYDLPGRRLRKRGELLRLRRYGKVWNLTHKAKGKKGPYKSRVETETQLADGKTMAAILQTLGFQPTFVYEKFRAEWSDGAGQVVLDQTPLGNLGEIEGPATWIDGTASKLGIDKSAYMTATYVELFLQWKRRTRSPAQEMTFRALNRN